MRKIATCQGILAHPRDAVETTERPVRRVWPRPAVLSSHCRTIHQGLKVDGRRTRGYRAPRTCGECITFALRYIFMIFSSLRTRGISVIFSTTGGMCDWNIDHCGTSSCATRLASNTHRVNVRRVTNSSKEKLKERTKTQNALCNSQAGADPSSHSSFSQHSNMLTQNCCCHLWN